MEYSFIAETNTLGLKSPPQTTKKVLKQDESLGTRAKHLSVEQDESHVNPKVKAPCFLVAATLLPCFSCLTPIATSLPQDSMLEQTEKKVVMLTKVLFEKEQMPINSHEKKMSGAVGKWSVQCVSVRCRCAG